MTTSPTSSDTGAPADDAVVTGVDPATPSPAAAAPVDGVADVAAASDGDAVGDPDHTRTAVDGPVDGTSGAPVVEASAADRSLDDTAAAGPTAPEAARLARAAVPTAPVPSGGSAAAASGSTPAVPARGEVAAGEGGKVTRLEEEGEVAADYLEELLDIVDLDGDIDIDVADARAVVSIVGEDDGGAAALRTLAGPHGEVLEALQELTRLAVQTRTGERSRLMLDVAGYRAERREQLLVIAGEALRRVEEDGEPVALDPMNPFERKVVHDAVAAAGLVSDSDGVEPQRRVVIHPRQG